MVGFLWFFIFEPVWDDKHNWTLIVQLGWSQWFRRSLRVPSASWKMQMPLRTPGDVGSQVLEWRKVQRMTNNRSKIGHMSTVWWLRGTHRTHRKRRNCFSLLGKITWAFRCINRLVFQFNRWFFHHGQAKITCIGHKFQRLEYLADGRWFGIRHQKTAKWMKSEKVTTCDETIGKKSCFHRAAANSQVVKSPTPGGRVYGPRGVARFRHSERFWPKYVGKKLLKSL